MVFRLSSKAVALTYPQCDATKAEALVHFRMKYTDELEEWCIAQEEHKEQGTHLHCYLKFKNKIDTRDEKYFDFDGHHGHYKGCNKLQGWIEYILKEDQNPLGSQDWKAWLMKSKNHLKRNRNQEQTKLLLEVGPYKMLQMGEIAPSQYKTWKNAYELIIKDRDQELAGEKEDLEESLPNTWGLKLTFALENKRCHFWIFSTKANMGKTTFLKELEMKYRVSWWNTQEIFQNQISHDSEVVVFDEFRGAIKISVLNALCDGHLMIPMKGLPPFQFKQKPLVIICGNKSPEDVYKEGNLEYIYARFQIIDLEKEVADREFRANIIIARNSGSGKAADLVMDNLDWPGFGQDG